MTFVYSDYFCFHAMIADMGIQDKDIHKKYLLDKTFNLLSFVVRKYKFFICNSGVLVKVMHFCKYFFKNMMNINLFCRGHPIRLLRGIKRSFEIPSDDGRNGKVHSHVQRLPIPFKLKLGKENAAKMSLK